jgi:hypothetical protein
MGGCTHYTLNTHDFSDANVWTLLIFFYREYSKKFLMGKKIYEKIDPKLIFHFRDL